jgi:tRNA(adenine34) deaminase
VTERRPRRRRRAWRLARLLGRGISGSRPRGTLEPGDYELLNRANQLAYEAERAGNVPIGAVIALEGRVIAEGRNAVYRPFRHPGRHAETEALRAVPDDLWPRAREMTCYASLEPCLMCLSSLYFHGVQRIVFGASAPAGGGGYLIDDPPWYMRGIQWLGPVRDGDSRELRRRVRRSLLRNG